jgi:hypothetical protein
MDVQYTCRLRCQMTQHQSAKQDLPVLDLRHLDRYVHPAYILNFRPARYYRTSNRVMVLD